MKQARNCKSLHIPFEYCLCERQFKMIKNATLSLKIASKVVQQMNKAIKNEGFVNECVKLTVNKNQTIEKALQIFEEDGYNDGILIKTELIVEPSGGLYEILVNVS